MNADYNLRNLLVWPLYITSTIVKRKTCTNSFKPHWRGADGYMYTSFQVLTLRFR